ncbi:cysteine desulfurase family protein [Aquimarina celericrescens]|uniref:cysteine desulfurase n=1 Tax=Aquimarina celericrescens TaxID=1964542 RepID=A0ABW5AU02_9FLAO|nr:cysteine desulfurase [Aquimarina celericrescens]
MNNKPIYLDNASTTKVDDRVLNAMLPYFNELYGNASSNHEFGKQSMDAITNARKEVANLINAIPEEIVFTSGATEAINMAIKGYWEANHERGNHIITVKTEHKAVLKTCEYLEEKGVEVTYLDINEDGVIELQDLIDAIKEDTILVSIMYVNNEIGVIQPIQEIGSICKERNIAFFTDATQAVGKMVVDVLEDNIDILCFSAHKINGPKGTGALYIKNDIKLIPLIHGGGQENELRGGTHNTPGIVGLGKACEIVDADLQNIIVSILDKRDEFEKHIETNNIGVINFKDTNRAPHISSITLNNIDAEDYLLQHKEEFYASTASACNSNLVEISHVIEVSSIENKEHVFRVSFS